jgi:hypothetical protein
MGERFAVKISEATLKARSTDPDDAQLSRFLISEMQRLVGLSVEAIALIAALESVNRWISGAGSSAA